jgi:sulfate transport system ATP-binding protein
MNEGRIEQIGTAAEIYDQPATPFVMSFVGEVNILPRVLLQQTDPDAVDVENDSPVFVRPHDVEVFTQPVAGSLPARLKRLRPMGRDLQAELVLSDGQTVLAQVPRGQLDPGALKVGDTLHLLSRQARTFEPDYTI